MSTNPYQSPSGVPELQSTASVVLRVRALQLVSSPANALMIVAGISIVVLGFAILEALLLVSRANSRPGLSVTIFGRLIWPFAIFGASCYVFWGALQMKRLASFSVARSAAIIACLPCVGPCGFLGIPFGAWALSVLGQPDVRKSFKT